jgi:hypothetical protein
MDHDISKTGIVLMTLQPINKISNKSKDHSTMKYA